MSKAMTHVMTMARLASPLLLLAGPALAGEAQPWQTLQPQSRLGFIAMWEDTPFNGEFVDFTADIRFAPDGLEGSRFDVTIDVTSADSGSRDRDEAMADADWFDFERHPVARFVAGAFERIDATRFVAVGELSIKGRSRPVRLPFTWRAEGDQRHLRAEVVLQRTDFGIGEGEWADGDIIGIDVRVIADLVLDSAG